MSEQAHDLTYRMIKICVVVGALRVLTSVGTRTRACPRIMLVSRTPRMRIRAPFHVPDSETPPSLPSLPSPVAGPIPKEIGNLSLLENLFLGNNNLSGEQTEGKVDVAANHAAKNT